jgi:hypothetical protein
LGETTHVPAAAGKNSRSAACTDHDGVVQIGAIRVVGPGVEVDKKPPTARRRYKTVLPSKAPDRPVIAICLKSFGVAVAAAQASHLCTTSSPVIDISVKSIPHIL